MLPPHSDPADVLRDGFERAVARGTLLHVKIQLAKGEDDFYFFNSEKGRTAVIALQGGAWIPGDEERPIGLILERPNIFILYEQNIGLLTPLIADDLRDLEKDYPLYWLQDAIKLAARNQAKHLGYVKGILDRWRREGRSDSQRDEASDQEALERLKRKFANEP